MKSLQIQDPKTFDQPSENKVIETIKLFFTEQKQEFINSYHKLNNTDKFYTLYISVLNFSDHEMAKRMFLDELRQDLETLKIFNRPSLSNLDFQGITEYKDIMDKADYLYDQLTILK